MGNYITHFNIKQLFLLGCNRKKIYYSFQFLRKLRQIVYFTLRCILLAKVTQFAILGINPTYKTQIHKFWAKIHLDIKVLK